jgi:hypothetical protein
MALFGIFPAVDPEGKVTFDIWPKVKMCFGGLSDCHSTMLVSMTKTTRPPPRQTNSFR